MKPMTLFKLGVTFSIISMLAVMVAIGYGIKVSSEFVTKQIAE